MTTETYVEWWSRRRQVGYCTLTAKRCRELVDGAREDNDLDRPSRVNPTMTRKQALDIFAAALTGKPDDAPIHVSSAKNITRECGLPRGKLGNLFPWPRPTGPKGQIG